MIIFSTALKEFKIQTPLLLKDWLRKIIQEEQKLEGEIRYIMTDDDSLSYINYDFLKHDTYTDIITFNTSDDIEVVSGEIYISIDRVKDNSKVNNGIFEKELARVMVHGILHLFGYKDKTAAEKLIMRAKEDYCLNLLPIKNL